MGYFSNGSVGCDYEARWCAKCYHARNMYPYNEAEDEQIPCPVWELHFLHKGTQVDEIQAALDTLIPRDEAGNGQCKMFTPLTSVPATQR